MDKYKILQKYFGHSQFRDGQENIIDNILSGRDIIAIMPTGAGKSICYQIPALILEGITIVVSPLISLMCDQVSALVQSGVAAAYINSSLTPKQLNLVFHRANQGRYKIIYVAPERLTSPEFLYFAEHNNISMVTVDEAHCVSHWGQNFRPSYLKISDFISMLSYRPIISAFTATATKEVKNDITRILQLNNPFTIATGFNRQNLYFEVKKPENKPKELLSLISVRKNKSGIIYCNTRKNVEDICYYLQQRGYNVTRYHAGLDNAEREQNQKSFIYDQNNIMVATNAFGMGIDKSNVSFVIHYNMPKSLEDYYQEAGRAGRDGELADCILLYTPKDVRTNQFLIENSSDVNEDLPENTRKRILNKNLDRLREMTFYCTTRYCLRHYILKYFGEFSPKECNNCSVCTNKSNEHITKPLTHQGIDMSLLVKLKSLRSDISQRTHVPAYIIFSDATLRDMCVKLPKNKTQFLSVIGVGQHKSDIYGEEFINLINDYLSKTKQ